jgi:hypothetical protein
VLTTSGSRLRACRQALGHTVQVQEAERRRNARIRYLTAEPEWQGFQILLDDGERHPDMHYVCRMVAYAWLATGCTVYGCVENGSTWYLGTD